MLRGILNVVAEEISRRGSRVRPWLLACRSSQHAQAYSEPSYTSACLSVLRCWPGNHATPRCGLH